MCFHTKRLVLFYFNLYLLFSFNVFKYLHTFNLLCVCLLFTRLFLWCLLLILYTTIFNFLYIVWVWILYGIVVMNLSLNIHVCEWFVLEFSNWIERWNSVIFYTYNYTLFFLLLLICLVLSLFILHLLFIKWTWLVFF